MREGQRIRAQEAGQVCKNEGVRWEKRKKFLQKEFPTSRSGFSEKGLWCIMEGKKGARALNLDYMMDYQWRDEARPVEKTNTLEILRNASGARYTSTARWAVDNGIAMPTYFECPQKFFLGRWRIFKMLRQRLDIEMRSAHELGYRNSGYD